MMGEGGIVNYNREQGSRVKYVSNFGKGRSRNWLRV